MASSNGCDILYLIRGALLASRGEPLDGLASWPENQSCLSLGQEGRHLTWDLGPQVRITHRKSLKGTC